MASFNKVILIGNLTRDPETRTATNGNTVGRLSLAVNRKYSDRDGQPREEVTFVDIDAFGKPAEVIAKYLKRGAPLMVEGRLKLDKWEKDGQKRQRLGVILETFQFLGSGSSSKSSESADAAPEDDEPPF